LVNFLNGKDYLVDKKLEEISEQQIGIVNDLLFYVIDQCIEKSKGDPETFSHRKKDAEKLFRQLYGSGSKWPAITIESAVERWYHAELAWSKNQNPEQVVEAWFYRMLTAFSRNHVMVPFTKEERHYLGKNQTIADSADFESFNAKAFQAFCERFLAPENPIKKPGIFPSVDHLKALADHDLSKAIYSARHTLMGKDGDALTGILLGGTVGVLASLLLVFRQ